MKKSLLISIVLTVFLGSFFGKFLYERYESETVMTEGETLYFLQYGVYSSEEEAKKNQENLEASLLVREDNKFYLYLGISLEKENLDKVQTYYDQEDKTTYIKALTFTDNTFINHLSQWDVLLSNASSKEELLAICKVVLADYEETVLRK